MDVPHVDEILLRLTRDAKVGHASFVDDTYLVEVLVERLAGLVDGYDRRLLKVVRRDPQGTDEL